MSDLKLSPQTLALYLGCEVFVPETNKKGTFEGINWVKEEDGSTLTVIIDVHYSHAKDDWDVLNENDGITRVKPVLKKLSSMTEEEKRHIYKMVFGRDFIGSNVSKHDIGKKSEREVWWSGVSRLFFFADGEIAADDDLSSWPVNHYALTAYLLSKHFDLFGLINANLAIEKQ